MTAYDKILQALASSGVEFILVGGMAGVAHGSARFTSDVDLVYRIRRGLNFTLTTTIGNLDLLGEVSGGGGFEQLLSASGRLKVFGVDCWVLGLDKLIDTKRAAGRPKDLEAIAELEALREERGSSG